jgi:hypothetical protein
MRKGFIFLPLLLVVAIVAIIAGGIYVQNKNNSVQNSSDNILLTSTPTAGPTVTPTFSPTPTAKPTPTKKPFTPTPKPTTIPTAAESGCSKFKPEDGLTTITITLKEKDNKPLVGDWIVKIKPTGSCPGILPPGWGSEINEVIKQPNYNYTSPGLHPGQFRVDVQYHFTGEGLDWDGTSGNHTREVSVSN